MQPHCCPKDLSWPEPDQAAKKARRQALEVKSQLFLGSAVLFLSGKGAEESAVPSEQLSALVGTQEKLCSRIFPPQSDPS